ncbi:hypothetical protein [Luteolibacter marinus]|uniref:hypothetical protein n=1 Tax=Luteolibacter marinus TaxID=2776705 RepID=UPI00186678D5|nr:hypothetical protein [Luteolibacter marinus]
MPDPAERFIDAVVRPLGDNAELEIAARNELAALISGDEESLERAARQLESAGRVRWSGWKIALYAVTFVMSLVSLEVARRGAVVARKLSEIAMGTTGDTRDLPARRMSAEDCLLLFGDTSKHLKSERMKVLWDAAPDNPAYFAEYSILHRIDHDSLPPDFLATAERLDPDNAWFTLMAASAVGKDAVTRLKLTGKERKNGALPGSRLVDEDRYREALELVAKAASQSRFDSYQDDLIAKRIPLLPKRTDLVSQILPIAYLAGSPADTIRFRSIVDVVDAECAALAANGDAEGLVDLAAKWEACLGLWSEADSGSLVDPMVLKVCIHAHAKRMADAAGKLGLEEVQARWAAVDEQLTQEKEARDRHGDRSLRMKGGIFAGLALPAVANQSVSAPIITDEDLRPGRLVDHELFGRVFSSFIWLVLGLMASAAAFYRMRASLLVRRLSLRFEALFRPADWLWVMGGGIVLPFAFYQVVYRLTPFGARDWSVTASGFMVPGGQFSSMGMLMIVMPVLIARWRLGARGDALGFRKARSWAGWGAVVCGALAIPVFGMSFKSGEASESVTKAAAVLLGVLMLAWLAVGMRAVFGRKAELMRRLTMTRILVPAYVSGMLLMVTSMPVYHALEKHWLAQDRLMEITPESPGWTRYEYQVAQAMRAELREMLGM